MIKHTVAGAAAAVLLLWSGCKREEVTHARVAKASGPALAAAPGGPPPGMVGPPPGMAGDVAPPPAPSRKLAWKLPNGWNDSRPGGMRYATLKPAGAERVDVSVTFLPGTAGGELANVNRWRGQIGLPPLDAAALGAARKPLRAKAGTVSLYDFTSEGQQKNRMIAGLLVADGNSWFVKMVGEAGPVGAVRGDFMKVLESLHFE
jgi:hypothetical protein